MLQKEKYKWVHDTMEEQQKNNNITASTRIRGSRSPGYRAGIGRLAGFILALAGDLIGDEPLA